MVSNARLDLPEPDRPVTTISLSRGISTEMFFRLCTRAPCTAMVVRAAALLVAVLVTVWVAIARFLQVDERLLLYQHVAPFRELQRRGSFANQTLVGQVFTC